MANIILFTLRIGPMNAPWLHTSMQHALVTSPSPISSPISSSTSSISGDVLMSDYINTEEVETEKLRPNNLSISSSIGGSAGLDVDNDIVTGMAEFLSKISF